MAHLVRGALQGSNIAAKLRTGGDYRTAAIIENFYGEQRAWNELGQTHTLVYQPTNYEFDKRCNDPVLARDYMT